MLKIKFLGDIVGRPGRLAIKTFLSDQEQVNADLVIANAENSAGGNGLTAKLAHELNGYGCELLTLGDHVWDQKNFEREIDQLPFVCRPYNLPNSNPGKPYLVHETSNGTKVAVATFLGRSFMGIKADCPFLTVEKFLDETKEIPIRIVEIHAEATAEKIAFGWHLNGRVSAVLGTHTHTPTADAEVLDKGTAYMTDLGMTGPYRSVLGREIDPIIQRFKDGLPRKCPVAEADVRISGAHLEIDTHSGKALKIEPLQVKIPECSNK